MSTHMALRISTDNLSSFSIVNGGLSPSEEAINDYFVFPYNYDAHCEILSEEDFRASFRFLNKENTKSFVDCEYIV